MPYEHILLPGWDGKVTQKLSEPDEIIASVSQSFDGYSLQDRWTF